MITFQLGARRTERHRTPQDAWAAGGNRLTANLRTVLRFWISEGLTQA